MSPISFTVDWIMWRTDKVFVLTMALEIRT